MARDFSKISPNVWTSKKFIGLATNEARLAYLYFLTGKHQSSAGVSYIPTPYAAHDLGWSQEQIQETLADLLKSGLIEYDFETEELLITGWFKHNVPMNSKHCKGVIHTLERVESQLLYQIGITELQKVYFDPEKSGPNKPPEIADDSENCSNSQFDGTKRPHELTADEVVEARRRNSANQINRLAKGFKVIDGNG